MKLEFACEVNIGPRPTNDDRAMILGEILDQRFLEGEAQTPAAAVVCDGCGGYAGGGTAAETVLEEFTYDRQGNLYHVNAARAGRTYDLQYDLLDREYVYRIFYVWSEKGILMERASLSNKYGMVTIR